MRTPRFGIEHRTHPASAPVGGRRTAGARGRPALMLAGIWVLGLIALGAIIQFERRVDESRRAQTVIAGLRIEQGALLSIAFAPATAGLSASDEKAQQRAAELVLTSSTARLADLVHNGAPARIAALNSDYFRFVDELAALVLAGASGQAALEQGRSLRPGGIEARLAAELDRADLEYGNLATRSRQIAEIGSIGAILLLLAAFSVALGHSLRARRRSQLDATTDALTGLGNRRQLFSDRGLAVCSLRGEETMTVGIFDLDGFKAYNDTFGHPAGDALLARLGGRLAAAVGEHGDAYRIGGDEFVVTSASCGLEVMESAQSALSERGAGFSVGCSFGSTRVTAGSTLEDALHVADQQLYRNKRSSRSEARSDAKDALLQVLSEQNTSLVTHLEEVAVLAARTAINLGLPAEQVELTRLAAELHDVGKSAIPDAILNKAGPLDPGERAFMERHSVIGERIVAAASTLEAIAPIVRAAHERADGTGYPDRLHLHEIPICARIVAVVDAFHAMTHDRPYQRARSIVEAFAELRRCAGSQFDPEVTEALIAVCESATTKPPKVSPDRRAPLAA